MNYKNLYDKAISKYKVQEISPEIYTEKHHILPRHMGGDNSEENLVKVTMRQHILLHLLLWKAHNSIKDKMAYLIMSGTEDKRTAFIKLRWEELRGSKWTEEYRKLVMDGRKAWYQSEDYIIAQTKAGKAGGAVKARQSEERSRLVVENAERNSEWLDKKSKKTFYKFVSPDGLIFDSPVFAAKYYGSNVLARDIENWCKRKKYGWNTIPELAKK